MRVYTLDKRHRYQTARCYLDEAGGVITARLIYRTARHICFSQWAADMPEAEKRYWKRLAHRYLKLAAKHL